MFPLEQTAMREATRLFSAAIQILGDFGTIVRAVDWGRVRWELVELSGIALRQRVDRMFRYSLGRLESGVPVGIRDDREEVTAYWRDVGSWFVPPVIVTGEVLGINIT